MPGAARRTVQMTFTLPRHRDLVVAVSDGGGLQTPGGTTITWPAFDVPANASVLRTVTVRVDNPVTGGDTLTAQAQAVHIATLAGSAVTAGDNTAIVATGLSTRVWRFGRERRVERRGDRAGGVRAHRPPRDNRTHGPPTPPVWPR
ncbi:MAG: hypothetical protein R2851_23405 [Caldilineaceae bacterium]